MFLTFRALPAAAWLVCAFATSCTLPLSLFAQEGGVTELVDRLEDSYKTLSRYKTEIDAECYRRPFELKGSSNAQKEILVTHERYVVSRDRSRWNIQSRTEYLEPDNDPAKPSSITALDYLINDAVNKCRLHVQDVYTNVGNDPDISKNASWIVTAAIDPEKNPGRPAAGYLASAGAIFGYFSSDHMNFLPDVLRDSKLSLLDDEFIGKHKCKVLKSIGKYGTRRLWIDPSIGYQLVQAEVVRSGTDLVGTRELRSIDGKGNDGVVLPKLPLQRIVNRLENVAFRDVDGKSVVASLEETATDEYPAGVNVRFRNIFKFSDTSLSPTFSDKDFTTQLRVPNGTTVIVEDSPGISYEWQDGKIVRAFSPKIVDGITRVNRDPDRGPNLWIVGNVLLIVAIIVVLFFRGRHRRAHSNDSQ